LNGDTDNKPDHLIAPNKYSSFKKLVSVHAYVLKFVNKLKFKLKLRDPVRYQNMTFSGKCMTDNYFAVARKQILIREQLIRFPSCVDYFQMMSQRKSYMPPLVGQLNLHPGVDGLLRVKSKCSRGKNRSLNYFPILLHRDSELTHLIVRSEHESRNHVGYYSVLNKLRKEFYILKIFSLVRKMIQSCVVCRRFNQRTIKIKQNTLGETTNALVWKGRTGELVKRHVEALIPLFRPDECGANVQEVPAEAVKFVNPKEKEPVPLLRRTQRKAAIKSNAPRKKLVADGVL
jgi:hypothetical protein